MAELFELTGNMHMHTPYSDGEIWHHEIAEAAIAAGLDFIIVTDHNVWVDGVEGYYENGNGRVLLLVGEEVHHPRRQPQASHFLVYGAEKEMYPYAADAQQLIDETKAAGGYGFLAHPFEQPPVPLIGLPNLGWHDWEVDGYTGLEIWNYMSSFVDELKLAVRRLPVQNKLLAQLTAVYLALHPEKYITKPHVETLALWDQLLTAGKRIVAVGNSDAHGTPMSFGPIHRIIFPYEFLFRAVNTHLLLPEALNGDLTHDKRLVLTAIGKGHSWVGYDMIHPTEGFRFTGQGTNKGSVGDAIQLDVGATLQVKAPSKAHIKLIHRGEVVAEVANEAYLTHIPVEEGAYRVECTLVYQGKERGWIYSNPIYLY
ncbi:MAG: CehA/McbA family metallohydrolase [Anaerolineales bacterium]|nr:CehA/McbA family metallohydrolase [Anaerolineales bacterium]